MRSGLQWQDDTLEVPILLIRTGTRAGTHARRVADPLLPCAILVLVTLWLDRTVLGRVCCCACTGHSLLYSDSSLYKDSLLYKDSPLYSDSSLDPCPFLTRAVRYSLAVLRLVTRVHAQ